MPPTSTFATRTLTREGKGYARRDARCCKSTRSPHGWAPRSVPGRLLVVIVVLLTLAAILVRSLAVDDQSALSIDGGDG